MLTDAAQVERGKLELERKRLELEQTRAERDNSFLNKHFGVMITGIVSITAVIVSISQIVMAETQRTREWQAAKDEADRQWRIKAAEFVADNRSSIFGEDTGERQTFKRVIAAAFPKEISDQILVEVRQAESDSQLARFWKPGGYSIDPANNAALHKWLNEKGIGASPKDFLFDPKYASARTTAAKELELRERQATIANVPESDVAKIMESFRREGAASVGNQLQPDGRWTITATFPTADGP